MLSRIAIAAGMGAAVCNAIAAERPLTAGAPVVVTATRVPQNVSDATRNVTVITAEDIAAGGYQSLTELLQAKASVEVVRHGGRGQEPSAVFIRGAEARHTLVLIDGLRIGSATAGGTAFEQIPLSQIDRIEIVPGPLSGAYGSDAIGGVIQIFTKGGGAGASARAGIGTLGTREASAGYGRRVNGMEFFIGAGVVESREFDATKPSIPFGQHNPDTDRTRNRNFSGRLAQHFGGDRHEVGVTAFHSEGKTHFDASAFTDDVNRQALSAYSVYSRNRLTDSWTSMLRLGTTRDDLDTVGLFPSFFRTDQHQLTWQNDLITGIGTFIGGLEYLDQRVESNNAFSETERTLKSAFAGYQGTFGNHALQLNVRHDDDSQFGGQSTGSVGYGYRFTRGFRVRANAGTAFKAPTFNDLYFPDFPPFFFSNPNLRPERSRSREIGVDFDHGDHHLSATLFDNRITDLITVFTDPATFVSTTANLNKVRIEGAEFSYRALLREWQIQARLTLQDPRDEDTGAQLRRRAREFGAISAGRNFGPWRAAAEIVASGARYDSTVETPGSRMHGYALVNLVGGYSWSKEWSVNARWNNVFDRDYELAQFYNVPQSNLFVWLAWQPR